MTVLSFEPRRCALLNIDMQNCFVADSAVAAPGAADLLKRINSLAADCRAAGVLVVHASHVLRADGSNAGLLYANPIIASGMITKGNPSAALHAELEIDSRDILLEKPRFGAFHGTDLEIILRSRGVDTVIISGISTSVCCETTAREASARDFAVIFLRDGTATFGIGELSSEEVQRASCATIDLAFGQVAIISDVTSVIAPAVASSAIGGMTSATPNITANARQAIK
jgi:ureidoacrylate peracid hydrolase